MGMRFRRSMTIMPGVRVNLGLRGPSVTVGGKYARITTGPSGTRVGSSVPGTGVYFSQKVDPSSGRAAAPRPRAAARPTTGVEGSVAVQGTLYELLRKIPPREPGTEGLWAALTSSPKRDALRTISRVAAQPGRTPEGDSEVEAAVARAADSWSVQREAGIYYLERDDEQHAFTHLDAAMRLFAGDKRLYAVVASDAANQCGRSDYTISVLQPFVPTDDPDGDPEFLVMTMLAQAELNSGDPKRALEMLGRLPLRRRNLSQSLLLALCIRAEANHAAGRKAQAKKDLDRAWACDPDFAGLEDAAKALGVTAGA